MTVISKVLRMKSATVLIATLAANFVDAVPAVAGPDRLAHVRILEVTQPPAGWVEFCARQPSECAATTVPRDLALSPEAWKALMRVNKWVNETIKPLTDLEHWGVSERWSYPDDGYGDCEDYVLLKRRVLIQSGWPRETLLVTMVRDKKGEGHAVLTVTTDPPLIMVGMLLAAPVLSWWSGHCHVGFDRVGNETILVSGVVHFIELFRTGSSIPAPHNLRT